MTSSFQRIIPLALLSSAALSPLAAAQSSPPNTGPPLPVAGHPLALTAAQLASPDDLKSSSITVVSGLADLQEERLDCLFGVQLDGTLYMKSMLGIADAIVLIGDGVLDAARLGEFDLGSGRDAIVSVGPLQGLAAHFIKADGSGAVTTLVLDQSATGATQVAAGDVNGDGREDIILSSGQVVTVRDGNAPYAVLASFTAQAAPQELLTLNWNQTAQQQILLQYGDGFQILDYSSGSLNVIFARSGATLTSFYAPLPGQAPTGLDELAWVMDHPSLGWIALTLWSLPGSMSAASGIGVLDNSWDVTGMSAGDLDGDGRSDLALSLGNSDLAAVLVNRSASSSVTFSHSPGASYALELGTAGMLTQSPITVGDFDDNGEADLALATSNGSVELEFVFDNVTQTVAQAGGPQTPNLTGERFAYGYTPLTYSNGEDEDDFLFEEEPYSGLPADRAVDVRFLAEQSLPGVSESLQVGLFFQEEENLPVQSQAMFHRRGLAPVSQGPGGVDNDYRFAFPHSPAIGEDLSWTNSRHVLYMFLRPERGANQAANRPPLIVGMDLDGPWGNNAFSIQDPTVGAPTNSALWLANSDIFLPGMSYSGSSCPADPGLFPRAPVGGIVPIKRLVPPSGSNPTLGTDTCVTSNHP